MKDGAVPTLSRAVSMPGDISSEELYHLSSSSLSCAVRSLLFYTPFVLKSSRVRSTLTERCQIHFLPVTGMQKSLRSDLGSDRGRTFLCTEDGHINSAFTRVSAPQALELHTALS